MNSNNIELIWTDRVNPKTQVDQAPRNGANVSLFVVKGFPMITIEHVLFSIHMIMNRLSSIQTPNQIIQLQLLIANLNIQLEHSRAEVFSSYTLV